MSKPRALDLFCGAGGASMGLHRAGFDVTGVDIEPQPRYPFPFIQADALEFPLEGCDFIWASPPCQAFVSLRWMYNAKQHEDLVEPIRERLIDSGAPYVIENVVGARLRRYITLCGSMFNLGSSERGAWLRRHRIFEASFEWPCLLPPCRHSTAPVIGVYGGHGRDRRRTHNTQDFSTAARREAMGIDWMTSVELSQAIPPAYSEFIGKQALAFIQQKESV